MLQKILLLVLFLALAVVIMFFFRGKASQNGQAPGLVGGQLSKCSSKPNCACSEYADDDIHFVKPIDIAGQNPAQVWSKLQKAIESTGGIIVESSNDYLAATYTSGLFKFVDDVEARLDIQNNVIHIRSASREGYSDLGVNAKRVAAIKSAL